MRTLIYDIETSYIITQEKKWGIWDERPIQREIIQDWQILCFAYKWLDEKKTHVIAQDDFKGYKAGVLNDRGVVQELHKLFCEADVVVAHNGNSFDQKKAQARMMIHKLPPPIPYAQVDTKLAIKQVAAHTSNKLFDLAQSLELTHKLDAGGMATWEGCMAGDKKAWKKMKKYNKGDVVTLEALYLEIRPWMKRHPAVNVLDSRPNACPKCGKEKMHKVMKYRATNTNLYQYYRCYDCGGMSKSRIPEYKQSQERMVYTNAN
jgi:DNA-directed RNA polymerase subunit M/transcription elongation factor TFIIS